METERWNHIFTCAQDFDLVWANVRMKNLGDLVKLVSYLRESLDVRSQKDKANVSTKTVCSKIKYTKRKPKTKT
jgi:membrane-anchored glycerophosphoryl diester phosphodiesterase (GDPDase)